MGIRITCPNGHRLHIKGTLAGKRGICPTCGSKFLIPTPANTESAEVKALASPPDVGPPSVEIPIDQAPSNPVVTVPSQVKLSPVLADSPPSPSPAGTYFSSRRRNHHRSQLKTAIVLLVVALILVLVLIWVLMNGRGQASVRWPSADHLAELLIKHDTSTAQPPFDLAPIHGVRQT